MIENSFVHIHTTFKYKAAINALLVDMYVRMYVCTSHMAISRPGDPDSFRLVTLEFKAVRWESGCNEASTYMGEQ